MEKCEAATSAGGNLCAHHADELSIYQESLPVRLIATARDAFARCHGDESLREALPRASSKGFDFLPVFDGDSVIGVLPAHHLQGVGQELGSVADYMEPLTEKFLIGADASIIDFVRDADVHPFRFVIQGRSISGLVSLSDLQRLPVRAALFAMVTQLEMAMADRIRRVFPDDKWIAVLNETRQLKLREKIDEAQQDGNQVESLLYTEFSDKADVVCRVALDADITKNGAVKELGRIRRLRDNLAHANQFAESRDQARSVCEVVRSIDRWILRMAAG